jgi:uncharacterized protein (DUF58 family)
MIETILQRVTYIPLPVRWFTRQPHLGVHKSRQRGTGLEFDQIVEYRDGETIQKINWAATARRGGDMPFVNRYYEDKVLTLMLLVDMSASMDFGSARLTKKSLAAEIAASLVYSALVGHDRVGLLGFVADMVCYVPPRQCQAYQRLIPESILTCEAARAAASFPAAVSALERFVKRRSLIFVLSDFLTEDVAELEQSLRRLCRLHEVIALVVTDPLEVSHPAGTARLRTRDLETGHLRSYSLTRRNQQQMARRDLHRRSQLRGVFERLRISHLRVTPHSNYCEDLRHLLLTRQGRASA